MTGVLHLTLYAAIASGASMRYSIFAPIAASRHNLEISLVYDLQCQNDKMCGMGFTNPMLYCLLSLFFAQGAFEKFHKK
jgi:hypothetical protein